MYVASLAALHSSHDRFLNPVETHRRTGLRRQADRDRFTLGTVLARAAVGHHTGTPPASIVLDRRCDHCGAQHGRPTARGSGTKVSISHAHDVVAVAVTGGQPVGVDVEATDAALRLAGDPSSVCTAEEAEHVQTVEDLLAYWTRKEAVLKALGTGLRTPMTELVVTPPESVPALTSLRGGTPPGCRMRTLPLPAGYLGAVAVLSSASVDFSTSPAATLLEALGADA